MAPVVQSPRIPFNVGDAVEHAFDRTHPQSATRSAARLRSSSDGSVQHKKCPDDVDEENADDLVRQVSG